jgi:hypothetical protein
MQAIAVPELRVRVITGRHRGGVFPRAVCIIAEYVSFCLACTRCERRRGPKDNRELSRGSEKGNSLERDVMDAAT